MYEISVNYGKVEVDYWHGVVFILVIVPQTFKSLNYNINMLVSGSHIKDIILCEYTVIFQTVHLPVTRHANFS